MKTRKASQDFDAATQVKICLAGFLPEIQAQAAAILADPAKASSWGRKLEHAARAAQRKVRRDIDKEPVLVDAAARALEGVLAAMEAVPAGSLSAEAYANLTGALDALATAARPLKDAYRDILLFEHDIPAFKARADEHIRAAAFLPPSQALHDRVCFLEGFRKGIGDFGRSLDASTAVSNIKRAIALIRPTIEDLPRDYRARLKQFECDRQLEREINIISEGLPAAVGVRKPLHFRPGKPGT
jgi:hypothetical protein